MTSVQFYTATMQETIHDIGVFRRYHVRNNPINNVDPLGFTDLISREWYRNKPPGKLEPQDTLLFLVGLFPELYRLLGTHGNWGGAFWTGGTWFGTDVNVPAVDSMDECFKPHDLSYSKNHIQPLCKSEVKVKIDKDVVSCLKRVNLGSKLNPLNWKAYLYRRSAIDIVFSDKLNR